MVTRFEALCVRKIYLGNPPNSWVVGAHPPTRDTVPKKEKKASRRVPKRLPSNAPVW